MVCGYARSRTKMSYYLLSFTFTSFHSLRFGSFFWMFITLTSKLHIPYCNIGGELSRNLFPFIPYARMPLPFQPCASFLFRQFFPYGSRHIDLVEDCPFFESFCSCGPAEYFFFRSSTSTRVFFCISFVSFFGLQSSSVCVRCGDI